MDFRWLDDVLILLEERNLSRAAVRRHITQPAFSRRIKSFEDWIGTPLLERKTNSVELSHSLLANEEDIRSLILRINELKQKIRNYRPDRTHVTIATQHALMFSTFPDLAHVSQANASQLDFRLRAGNRDECISIFIRGDANMLLCYTQENAQHLLFNQSVKEHQWGEDQLVPVIGGQLRSNVYSDMTIEENMPAIVYPEQSHFGGILNEQQFEFANKSRTANPFCETAYSTGIKEMISKGLGVGWLPMSMVYRDIELGNMINLSAAYGSVALKISLYANIENDAAAYAFDELST